jgi:hypothetical protein
MGTRCSARKACSQSRTVLSVSSGMHACCRRQQQARICVGNEWSRSCGMLDESDSTGRTSVCQYMHACRCKDRWSQLLGHYVIVGYKATCNRCCSEPHCLFARVRAKIHVIWWPQCLVEHLACALFLLFLLAPSSDP